MGVYSIYWNSSFADLGTTPFLVGGMTMDSGFCPTMFITSVVGRVITWFDQITRVALHLKVVAPNARRLHRPDTQIGTILVVLL